MVKILKDGTYNGFHYKKGEIYEITEKSDKCHAFLKVNYHKSVIVSLIDDDMYGLEAKIITENPNKIIELW